MPGFCRDISSSRSGSEMNRPPQNSCHSAPESVKYFRNRLLINTLFHSRAHSSPKALRHANLLALEIFVRPVEHVLSSPGD